MKSSRIFFLPLLLLISASGIAAPTPVPSLSPGLSRAPVLRIETGSHLASITRLSSDAAGRWLVSASEDKTVRVWDAASGQPVSVLRPPIGVDSLGSVYAVAMSPDGATIAVGGNSAFEGGSGHLVHLFERTSASIPPKSTLTGLEAAITQMAWSRDGQMLAIGLRQQGLRVFRRNLQPLGADPEFNEAIFGADFSNNGRLAVASIDGAVRLYQLGKAGQDRLERIARKQMPGGKPYSVVFSPDGKTLAVGYQEQARVDLLDANTLSLIHSVERKSGNLGRVAWSADGNELYAAGTHSSGGHFPVLAIDNGGRGSVRELGQFNNTVMALLALPNGRVAAASAAPSWAVFDSNANTLVQSRPQSMDFRDLGSQFKLSPSANVVSFRSAAGGENLSFDLSNGSMNPAMTGVALASPRSATGEWKNSPAPQVNGRVLVLKQGESARSLAMMSDERGFVMGSDWSLRRFNAEGGIVWERRVPAVAWAVNTSSDGRWVVAGLGDGSIRWFSLADGAEQIALFVHSDRQRWIAWTPSGYYDTSVGGEALVGWHLNRAFNQSADFFTAGRFRDKLYRPDIIQKMLLAGGEPTVSKTPELKTPEIKTMTALAPSVARVESVSEILPPVIELRSDPQIQATSGTGTVPVRLELRSPSDAPVTGLKARVNGKLVRNLSGRAVRSAGVQSFDVPIPDGDSEILIFAENRFGKSDPAIVKVQRQSEIKTSGQKTHNFEKYENLYLFVVGISKYPKDRALGLADKDARDFSEHMANQTGKLYSKVVKKLLTNEQATRANILDGLKWLRESVGEKDVGVVFFAGHGEKVGSTYYFIPSDPEALPDGMTADWPNVNAPKLWVAGDEISKTLLGLKGRAAFFIDTCHAGQAARQAQKGSADMTGALNEIDDEKGVIVFASATGRELAQEDDSWGNGAFTKAIVEGIKGEADKDHNGFIRPSYLSAYVNDRVRELTKNEQRPVIFTVGIDDPIAVKTK